MCFNGWSMICVNVLAVIFCALFIAGKFVSDGVHFGTLLCYHSGFACKTSRD